MKKKILILINSGVSGGAEKALVDLLKQLDKKKYEIDLVVLKKSGVYIEEYEKYSNKVRYIITNKLEVKNKILNKIISGIIIKLFVLQFIFKIENKYDIEISFLEGVTGEFISRRKNNSYKIAWIHTNLLKMKIPFWIKKNIYKSFDKVICVSKNSEQALKEKYPNLINTTVINNMILKKEILIKAQEKSENIKTNNILLITAGRLENVKGFDTLLKAIAEVFKDGYTCDLKILGEGSEKENLKKYIRENKLEKNVELLGFKKNPYPYLKQGDVYIMTSRYEGYPLILCEAMTLGLPIISTKCSGANEILNFGQYGAMVEIDNIKELKDKIIEMIIDKQKREKYKKLSLDNANNFSEIKILTEIENIFIEEKDVRI